MYTLLKHHTISHRVCHLKWFLFQFTPSQVHPILKAALLSPPSRCTSTFYPPTSHYDTHLRGSLHTTNPIDYFTKNSFILLFFLHHGITTTEFTSSLLPRHKFITIRILYPMINIIFCEQQTFIKID